MRQPSFDGCWAKVERAKEHRDALQRFIAETFAVESNRPVIGLKNDRNTGEHVLYVEHVPDFSTFLRRVVLILGDALHNLRSALDHLAFQLAIRHTGGKVAKPKAVQFPIFDSPADWVRESDRWLAEVSPADRAIIERFQPYHAIKSGEGIWHVLHPFRLIRDLSNVDKHRLVIAVILPDTDPRFRIAFENVKVGGHEILSRTTVLRVNVSSLPFFKSMELGAEVGRLPGSAAEAAVQMKGHFAPEVMLPQGPSLMDFLKRAEALVIKAICEFDRIL